MRKPAILKADFLSLFLKNEAAWSSSVEKGLLGDGIPTVRVMDSHPDSYPLSYVFSPYYLAVHMIEISQQEPPKEMKLQFSRGKKNILSPDELFEVAVADTFRNIFAFDVRLLGRVAKFKSLPDGVVRVMEPRPFSFVYDCKSCKSGEHVVLANHVRQYVRYVKNYELAQHLKGADLKYMVVIAPTFKGDTRSRIRQMWEDAGVELVLLEAGGLSYLSKVLFNLSPPMRRLFDLEKIFVKNHVSTRIAEGTFRRIARDMSQDHHE